MLFNIFLLCDLTFRSNKLSFVLKIGNKSQILSQYVMFDWRLEDVSLRWIRLESCWMLGLRRLVLDTEVGVTHRREQPVDCETQSSS